MYLKVKYDGEKFMNLVTAGVMHIWVSKPHMQKVVFGLGFFFLDKIVCTGAMWSIQTYSHFKVHAILKMYSKSTVCENIYFILYCI